MADNKQKSSASERKRKHKLSKFQSIGKYFLIILFAVGQMFIAYLVVANNYDAIYGYVKSLTPPEQGKYELEDIIVNPADTNGQRYLLVRISLELVDEEHISLIEENESKVRNYIISYLSARSVQELQGSREKEEVRIGLIKVINNAIDSHSVRNLYYSKYVMQ